DLTNLRPVAKFGFYVDPYTHALQISHRNTLDRESMLFVCVIEEAPDRITKRGASFYELHEVHIHPSELDEAQITPNNLQVLITFETVAYDPFPPGCSHTIGMQESYIEICYRRIRGKFFLPE
ncbi:unnamed protein product, partial [Hymenolepis diminuta]